MYRKIIYIASILILTSLLACDEGIAPKDVNEPTGFSGTVTFVGEWPAEVKRAFVVVFKDPVHTLADITANNLKFISSEIPLGVTTYSYSSLDSTYIFPFNHAPFLPGTYAYVAVVQQTTELVSFDPNDWFVIGVYYALGNPTKPGTIVITENNFLKNINITCDFNNPPPQPLGGN